MGADFSAPTLVFDFVLDRKEVICHQLPVEVHQQIWGDLTSGSLTEIAPTLRQRVQLMVPAKGQIRMVFDLPFMARNYCYDCSDLGSVEYDEYNREELEPLVNGAGGKNAPETDLIRFLKDHTHLQLATGTIHGQEFTLTTHFLTDDQIDQILEQHLKEAVTQAFKRQNVVECIDNDDENSE